MRFEMLKARQSPAKAATYVDAVLEPAFDDPHEGQQLFRLDLSSLVESDARICLVWGDGIPLGGLNWTIDGAGTAWIKGVRVRPSARGSGAASFLFHQSIATVCDASLTTAALHVRCDEAGVPNPAAFRLYSRYGFQSVGEPVTVRVSGDYSDKHIGPTGSSFLVQPMRAGEHSILAAKLSAGRIM